MIVQSSPAASAAPGPTQLGCSGSPAHGHTPSHLVRIVWGPVIVGHEELVEPLHELEIVLEPSLDQSVHLDGLVHVKLGKCGL